MNLIWNKNRDSFAARFPSLARMFSLQIAETDTEKPVTFWTILQAKNGSVIASENGTLLHSSYDPERESRQAVQKSDFDECTAAVFYGCGLGYTPSAYAGIYPDRTIIIIEPDPGHFFAALTLLDWTPVFSCPSCIIALGCPPETVIPLIEQKGSAHSAFFSVPSQTAHAKNYFDTIKLLVERNRQKNTINNATLERFGRLWMRNSCANIKQYKILDGVKIYSGKGIDFPFTIIAAGPSLEAALPHLGEIKKRSIIVCVDTALRACLRTRIEPDFIIIADPQYYAYRHIAGLSSPSSVLITDPAVYPAVYRFPCRKIVLCSSFFPLSRWFEARLEKKGDLGAGGSVASAAWNFAYLTGSREIYTVGLDLSFPELKTHIKGSTFEQAAHSASVRTNPAESINLPALFSGGSEFGCDYTGKPVLTDARMKMFAWWFESRLSGCTDARTYTFSLKGLAIPGILSTDFDFLLSKKDISAEKENFFSQSEKNEQNSSILKFDIVFSEFTEKLTELYESAKKGKNICENALRTASDSSWNSTSSKILSQLTAVDNAIRQNSLKDTVEFILPACRQQKKKQTKQYFSEIPYKTSLTHSLSLYTELFRIVCEYRSILSKQFRI
ncbi:MAG: DUF115 domain-containing protein [Treponema sp.]|nr:DUF115 domain-containing protein [Treponema sp.]